MQNKKIIPPKVNQMFVYNTAVEQVVRAFLFGPTSPQPLKDVPLYTVPLSLVLVGEHDVGFGAKPYAWQVTNCAMYGYRAKDILARLLAMSNTETGEPVTWLTNNNVVTPLATEVAAVYAAVYNLMFKKGKRKH